MRDDSYSPQGLFKKTIGVLAILALFVLAAASTKLFEQVAAGEIVVIQDPYDGELHFYTDPGLVYQNLGHATHYKKSFQYWFSKMDDQGNTKDQSIKIRFNDGGHATISGSVRVDLPVDKVMLRDIHTRLGSQAAIEQEVIRTVIEKSVYMSGPLMSSKESYAEKRNSLITYIEDQAASGIYRTISKEAKVTDPLTGTDKTVTQVEIATDAAGLLLRQESSPLLRFGLKLYNLSINAIDYDGEVEKQINSQQQATMEVQTAMAEAKKAEQRAITVEKQGEANAATAKWEQETIKAKAVVEAQMRLDVATLDRQAAEQTKQKEILLGEGEATRKKLVMEADGALSQKLEAWTKVNELYANAISNYKGNWVPGVMMGGSSANYGNGAQDLINLLSVSTAKQLSLDMSVPAGNQPPK
ncbi:MAG: SPFH domain-containing protein [Candidatus Parcubacteria bacterium]|nr:SPFH domain-containing protein [Candidatus Parcubacteria bacterium]